ncbi:hypothetical protein UCDDS831_g00727 [Diplodia seriata]|uniref:Uncharacterized protein n=1 Tax=Diplodia seriata TaxID=420778 RepID=A0A0G2EZN4_9PEZI|nr:hypothetical protein UCDDS831_g00727 [Diplodia seriata]
MAVTSIKPGGAGPLTTVFTTPDFCSSGAWSDVGTPALSSSICMPPDGWTEYWNLRAGFFSPAICPLGYTRGCAIPTSLATGISLGGPLATDGTQTETGHICCPRGYTCDPGDSFYQPWPYSKCRSTAATSYTTSNEITPAFVTTTSELVYAIQVRWRDADLSRLETNPTVYGQIMTATSATASTAARTTAAATASSTAGGSSVTNGSDDSSGGSGSGLSTGAQIGIIVGAVAGVIALAVGAYLLWRRRSDQKRHRLLLSQTASDQEMKPGDSYQHLSEDNLAVPNNGGVANSPVSPVTPGSAGPPSTAAMEMQGSTAFAAELPASQMHPVEAPAANAVIAELPGDSALFEKDAGRDGKA